ncbi:protein sprouty isoform X2 [Drosophila subobscura]|uniref:protein sprouty isoform X2 n=1 Tax=Drosophila subobscura TaxID=7241 RepID=UPI00155B2F31|nr:protein sprouty isoform X2 [Drosophila subobscura]
MDRRNGGDPLAPPRPPKLLPRVHRPRAPEPTLSGVQGGAASVATTANHNNNSQQQQLSINTATTTATTTINNNTISIIPASTLSADYDSDYQIHHLTFLPQRPSSLSRNSSNASSSTATANSSSTGTGSGSISVSGSSFRRRPPAPAPLLSLASAAENNNFLSHFQQTSAEQPVPQSPVTLAQPRPESERLTNEYVDTPLQHATRMQHPAGQQDNGQTTTHHLLLLPQRQQHHQQHLQHLQHNPPHHHQQSSFAQQQQQPHVRLGATSTTGATTGATQGGAGAGAGGIDHTDGLLHSHLHSTTPAQQQQQQQHHLSKGQPATKPRLGLGLGLGLGLSQQPITQPIITKQPTATTPATQTQTSKEHMHALEELLQAQPGSGGGAGPIVMGGDPTLMIPIVCPRCGRCRCEQCQSPRPLPQTWVCNKTCLCSAESIIDYASCLCCAKALFYHCARDNDMDCDDGNGTPCVDNPCSCGPYKRTQRWGWLGALSIVLPCLWCYWPMRGCMKLCEKCYGRFAGRGCRCQGVGGAGGGGIGSTSSMLPIVPLGVNGANGGLGGGLNGANNGGQIGGVGMGPLSQANGKAIDHGCSAAASRILRKGDLTPEKRLLDSSPDY